MTIHSIPKPYYTNSFHQDNYTAAIVYKSTDIRVQLHTTNHLCENSSEHAEKAESGDAGRGLDNGSVGGRLSDTAGGRAGRAGRADGRVGNGAVGRRGSGCGARDSGGCLGAGSAGHAGSTGLSRRGRSGESACGAGSGGGRAGGAAGGDGELLGLSEDAAVGGLLADKVDLVGVALSGSDGAGLDGVAAVRGLDTILDVDGNGRVDGHVDELDGEGRRVTGDRGPGDLDVLGEIDLSIFRRRFDLKGSDGSHESSKNGIAPEIYSVAPCPKDEDDCKWSEQAWYDAVGAVYTGGSPTNEETRKRVKTIIAERHLPPGFTAIDDRRYILRPEAIESVFIMYRITGDRKWQDAAWRMFQSIERITRTDIGASAIWDITVDPKEALAQKMDSMESFWLAETLKYFYLCFEEFNVVSLDDFVLNTEAMAHVSEHRAHHSD